MHALIYAYIDRHAVHAHMHMQTHVHVHMRTRTCTHTTHIHTHKAKQGLQLPLLHGHAATCMYTAQVLRVMQENPPGGRTGTP